MAKPPKLNPGQRTVVLADSWVPLISWNAVNIQTWSTRISNKTIAWYHLHYQENWRDLVQDMVVLEQTDKECKCPCRQDGRHYFWKVIEEE